jgi:ribonuclease HII
MLPNLKEEKKLFKKGARYIAGLDEAGRGPLAGPVVVGIVVFEKNNLIEWLSLGINDSKKLSSQQRQKILKKVKAKAKEWQTVRVGEKFIDKKNIRQATLIAMRRAFLKTTLPLDFLLIDGQDTLKDLPINQKAIVNGDEMSVIIAAASILAKETRDNIMRRYAKKYPQYGFEKHKGYGTTFHKDKILKYGPCKIHRQSFHLY